MKDPHQLFANALVLPLIGRLDHETTPAFREELAGAVRRAAGNELTIVLELSGLEYLSSPGLNSLIIGSRNARKEGVAIHAAALQPMVFRSWEISHLTLMVQTFPTLEEALQVVSAEAAAAYAAAQKSIKA
jgi:anti-sigma B factor antagonist